MKWYWKSPISNKKRKKIHVFFMTIAYLGYLCCYEAKPPATVQQFNFFFFFLNWGLNKRSRNHWNKKISTNSGNLGTGTAACLISCVHASSGFWEHHIMRSRFQVVGRLLRTDTLPAERPAGHPSSWTSSSICWCYHPGLGDTSSELLTFSKELTSTSQKAGVSEKLDNSSGPSPSAFSWIIFN